MEDFACTVGLMDLIENLPDHKEKLKALEMVSKMISYYKEEYQKALRDASTLDVIRGFYELIDENSKAMDKTTMERISCRKGCAHCCHLSVSTSKAEADLILEHCEENEIKIDYEILNIQATYTDDTFAAQKHNRCVFLNDENACKIYEVRPFACRKYFVVSKPALCDTIKYPKGQVLKISDMNAECIASAFCEQTSLSQALIKYKK